MRTSPIAALVAVIALTAAGCGGKSAGSSTAQSGSTQAGAVQAPANIKSAGKIVYCSDITYPPEEFYKGTTPTGSDIDIGTAIGQLMGVGAEFDNTGFDGIIAALLSNKCDAVISGMNDTPARRKQVGFVDYISVGQSLMVKGGNPLHITGLPSLAGKSVSVEVGTTNKTFLDDANKKLSKKMSIVTFPKDTDAANALKTGKVDAYFGDSPVVAYYIAQDPASFAFGGSPINPIPVGIAVGQKNTELKAAVQQAVDKLYANGTMKTILAKWKMSDFALKGK
jgi:polar amino acid transport system substrate-binding protein